MLKPLDDKNRSYVNSIEEAFEVFADDIVGFVARKIGEERGSALLRERVEEIFREMAKLYREDAILELVRAIYANNTEMTLMRAQFREVLAALNAPKEIVTDANGKPIGIKLSKGNIE